MGNCHSKAQHRHESIVVMKQGKFSKPIVSSHMSVIPQSRSSGQIVKNSYVIQPRLDVWVSRGMPPSPPELSQKNKRIVADSWVHMRPNMFKIGKVTFKKMFEAIPMIKESFERSKSDTKQRVIVKFHVDKVMLSVDRLVGLFFNYEQVTRFLTELGERHAEQTVRIELLDCFVPFFIMAMRPALNDRWADTIEDAWGAFFKYTVYFMKEAMLL